jgi:two-component system NarL family response regulator
VSEQMPKNLIRVLIVDDHPVVRAGLTSLLQMELSLKIVGSAHNAEEALSLLNRFPVDLVLLDLRMPKVSGIDFLNTIKRFPHPPAVLILSSYKFEEEIYRAVKAGAAGYLSKDASRAELVAAITEVSAGHKFFPRDVERYILERELHSDLGPRELEVLEMVAKGLTNREIAQAFQISRYTVRNHISHICDKLEVTDRTEAVAVALQKGIIETSC